MNKHLKKIADEARFVDTVDYPDQDVIFQKFAELLLTDFISRLYREELKFEAKVEKFVESVCHAYGIVK